MRVTHEFAQGGNIATEPTDEDGWVVLHGMPGGALVNVRTNSKMRLGDLRAMERLPKHGEHEIVLQDDGKRRVLVNAAVSDPKLPVSSIYVQFDGGNTELRPWPGGTRGTVELPDRALHVALTTAVGIGELELAHLLARLLAIE